MQSTLKIIFWNLLFISVGVTAIELFYGSWFSSNKLNDLNILRNRIWHYEFDYPGISEGESQIVYSRDRWGLRGDYGSPEHIDILTVGGSTTDQRYISDGLTWQSHLQKNFSAAGVNIGIANAGVDGRTTFGHQNDFAHWFPKIESLKPRYVLLYVGLNDMYFSQPNETYDKLKSQQTDLKQQLKGNSAIYKLLQSVLGTYRVEQRHMGHTALDYANAQWVNTGRYPVPIAKKLEPRLQYFKQRLNSLLNSIIEMGARPIIVTQPRGDFRHHNGQVQGIDNPLPDDLTIDDPDLGELNNHTANGVDYHAILNLFNQTSLQACHTAQAICIDLANQLEFTDGDFYDYAHNTQQGAEKIGDFLFKQLSPTITRE